MPATGRWIRRNSSPRTDRRAWFATPLVSAAERDTGRGGKGTESGKSAKSHPYAGAGRIRFDGYPRRLFRRPSGVSARMPGSPGKVNGQPWPTGCQQLFERVVRLRRDDGVLDRLHHRRGRRVGAFLDEAVIPALMGRQVAIRGPIVGARRAGGRIVFRLQAAIIVGMLLH